MLYNGVMSKLRDEEAAKRRLQEENDVILEIGKEGKEGVKNFKEAMKIEEEAIKERNSLRGENLKALERNKLIYNRFLQGIMVEQLKKIDWPSGWSFNTAATDKGVILEIKSPSKRYFRSAFASVGDGLLDLNAVQTFAVRAENTIDRVEREKITV